MAKTFYHYLMESDREYFFRIKSIEEIDAEKMDIIERLLTKYELRDITAPQKTVIQDHPLDFYEIQNAEVWWVDVVTGVPVSSYVLQQELRANLKIPEKFIVVRTDNDPLEVETERLRALKDMENEAEDKNLQDRSLLSTDSEYQEGDSSVEGDHLYGNEYNQEFLNTLARVSADRSNHVVNPKEGLFNWLESDVTESPEVMTADNFNDDVDSVKPVAWWNAKGDKAKSETSKLRGPDGNFDDDLKTHKRYYKTNDGNDVDMERETNAVR